MKSRAIVIAALTVLASCAASPELTVYKTPTCGCCGKWAEHMKANGFKVEVAEVKSTAPYRERYGVPDKLTSCHTAAVNGYVVEGHVPADDVKRLLKEKPNVAGIAVPGMPIGSPGMEQGTGRQAYSVVAFDKQGNITEFQRYEAKP